MMTKTQPASIGKPQRESVMGSEADQNHFGGTADSPELTTGIQRHTILHSNDGGLNWHMKVVFDANDVKKLEKMVWNFDGTCQTAEPPKPDKVRVFRVLDLSELSDEKIELKTTSQTDILPLSQSEESHTLPRAITLRSNTDSPNIDSFNKDRETYLQMDSDEDTESEEPSAAECDEDLKFEVDRVFGAAVNILGLQDIIRAAMQQCGDISKRLWHVEARSSINIKNIGNDFIGLLHEVRS